MTEKIFRKFTESPALLLDRTVDTSKVIIENFSNHTSVKSAGKYWKTLGPGLTTGAADDDPSGITTYSQAGAQYGFQFLWLSGFTFPLMALVQEMCARIGLATGRGLAGNIRLYFPKWVLYTCTLLLFVANTFNISADLGAMAKATQLLIPSLQFELLVIVFTVFSLGLQIFTTYEKYAKYLKWLALILLSYVFAALTVRLDIRELLQYSIIPSINFTKEQIFLICGVLGTTISPYLFFWQTSQEVEERILEGKTTLLLRQETTEEEVKDMRIDVWSGMFISNIVMFFIIATCAAVLNANGITNITSAEQAALALKPLAGEQAYLLFALGIIGTGLLAVPILAGAASYALSESLRWKFGLYRNLKEAPSFYGVIIISMFIGLGINFIGIDPIKTLIYSAVANGIIAPVILILIVLLSSNKKLMGKWSNNLITEFFGWLTVVLMSAASLATLYFLIFG